MPDVRLRSYIRLGPVEMPEVEVELRIPQDEIDRLADQIAADVRERVRERLDPREWFGDD